MILFFYTRTNFQIQVGKKLDRKMELCSLKNVLASDKINTFFGSDFPSCCLMTWQSSPDELLFETWVKNLFFFFLPAPVGGKTIFLKLFRSRLECFCGLSHVFQRVGRFRMTYYIFGPTWIGVKIAFGGILGERLGIFVKFFFNFCCSSDLERYKNLLRKNFFLRKKIFFDFFSLVRPWQRQ